MKEIEVIRALEPVFVQAGQLAKTLRRDAIVSRKTNSGVDTIDLVTSSDLAVQEFVLKKLASSVLNKCEIVAEEDTPSVNLFAKQANLVITLDPIDGTRNYTVGKRMYSIIVSLHDKKTPLYTFVYFPEIDWGYRITNMVEFFGEMTETPEVKITHPSRVIGYADYYGITDPQKTDRALYDLLTREGYIFAEKKEIGSVFGPVQFFINGITAGIFAENESAVDGLVALHYAIATNCTIHNHMDISKPRPSEQGGSLEYKGYYFAYRNQPNI